MTWGTATSRGVMRLTVSDVARIVNNLLTNELTPLPPAVQGAFAH